MTSTLVPTTDFFKLTESIDEKQIMNIQDVKDILCYKDTRSGKYELSYRGIKTLVLEMAAKGFPLEIIEAKVELLGEATEKTWYATMKIRNQNTKLESFGEAEQPYYENDGKYPPTFTQPLTKDYFARRKAFSKAERNANKKQLPEAMIRHLINRATNANQYKELHLAGNDVCTCTNPRPGISSNICVSCNKKVVK